MTKHDRYFLHSTENSPTPPINCNDNQSSIGVNISKNPCVAFQDLSNGIAQFNFMYSLTILIVFHDLPLQYPLLFPYGEDGYHDDIAFSTLKDTQCGGRKRISPHEYFSFLIHEKQNVLSTLLHSRILFQQFLVDEHAMVESGRLTYIRCH